ncbi:AEC family transporter [Arenicella sp.]|nr:AEC family transporter [Arenicella sp.]
MFQQVFAIVAPLFLIVCVGYLYGSRAQPAMGVTNRLVMDIFMPALIFHVMVQEDFYPSEYVWLMFGGVFVMLGSGIIAFVLARSVGFSWRSFVPPAMFSNWANLGLPLYVFSLGETALGGGIMLVVVGNILCFTVGTYIYSGKLSSLEVLRTPILLAVIVGAVVNYAGISFPVFIDRPIDMLGQVAIPLMLFSLGVRLTRVTFNDSSVAFVLAIFCPIVGGCLALLATQFLPLSDLHRNILLLFGILPPAVVNFMLAEQYNNEPEKVASMVLIGNLVSIFSIPLMLLLVLSPS